MMGSDHDNPFAAPFQGRWRIAETDLWDDESLDLVEPAGITIDGEGGDLQLAAMDATLDIRYDARNGAPIAEFTFAGFDEDEQVTGRGWLQPGTAGRLVGHLYFHRGDDSGFVCEPG